MNKIPILLDGAFGIELNNLGLKTDFPSWTADANITHLDLLQSIHKEYICAGENIITTNTFRTTRWTYKRAGYTDKESKMRAKRSLYSVLQCAQNASKGIVQIAGSIAILDTCYTPESFFDRKIAIEIYTQTLDWLINAGVDIFLLETLGNLKEIKIAFHNPMITRSQLG